MEVRLKWDEGMVFSAEAGKHSVQMDALAPIGKDLGPTPKQLLLASIAGCTAMDVAALMKKHKQVVLSFTMKASGDLTSEHPKVFKEIVLEYHLKGEIDPVKLREAVEVSMNLYCGVSASVAKVSRITYTVFLNGEKIASGKDGFWGAS